MSEDLVRQLAKDVGGEIESIGRLPDGSGFAVMSMPLPKDHWLYRDEGFEAPPMPLLMGVNDEAVFIRKGNPAPPAIWTKREWADRIRDAGRYAVRAATMKGKDMDFDPDALLQNLIVGLLGYWTENGLSNDEWANPPQFRKSE